MDFWESGNVAFGGVYGPAGGQGGSTTDPQSPAGMGVSKTVFGLEIPTLVALGVLTWWLMKKLD